MAAPDEQLTNKLSDGKVPRIAESGTSKNKRKERPKPESIKPVRRNQTLEEVHLLHDERGAVLETLVVRTERQVESARSVLDLVSA
jgi:hypothetical protein